MRAYRISVLGIVLFAAVYPAISGGVLVRDWHGGVGEIYPFAPWALFCFVPNYESDFAVRIRAIDGRQLDQPPYFEQLPGFDEHQKTIGRGVIEGMGSLAGDQASPAFAEQRRLFERNYLAPLGDDVRYELVRREYDVLERWKTGAFQTNEPVAALVYRADAEGP
jgi:hypothetical protein